VTSRLPHFLDNRLTDGGDVVSPTSKTLNNHATDFHFSFEGSEKIETGLSQKRKKKMKSKVDFVLTKHDVMKTNLDHGIR
jgi:hypothetical protein